MTSPKGFLSESRLENGSWRAVERAIGRLFVHTGWPHVAVVGGPGDHGADVIASSEERDVVAQVKFKSSSEYRAGKKIVRDVKRAMEFYDISEGVCVTNTRLSDSALEYRDTLEQEGYNIGKLEGARLLKMYNQLPRWPEVDFEPRDYQETPIRKLLQLYHDGADRALLSLATGLGKTFVAGRVLGGILDGNPELRILILADQKPLIRQFEESLWNHLPKEVSTHLWYGNESPAYNTGIDIGTFQSLDNPERFPQSRAREYDIVVVDEAHHAPATSYRRVLDKTDPDFLVGLTATPWREDNRSMEELFGPVRESLTIGVVEALRKGYLTDVDYRLYCDNIDWEHIHKVSQKDYTITDLNKNLFIQERDDEIIDEFQKVWEKSDTGRAIVYCASIDHAKRMATAFRERDFGARALHSSLKDREVQRRLRSFRRGDLEILTAVDMLNEGVDVPEVDIIVFLRVTHSRRIFLQQLGRGLRLAEGKEKVTVMDLVADIRRIAEAIEIDTELEKGEEREVLTHSFNLQFLDQQAQSFFREYLQDKAEISTYDDTTKVEFP
ncbi:restriction endonuclease subunit R [Haloplanus rubicundus]|uniref:Restriction endonuclease subunit R n=1 Tax=Haloplanus rubicundus TaxID=1547898 RepID=A0A345E2Y8_9EURY|nr:DEAD/DEAH box helicase family protein [Haloplanus rubicundus]AXG06560.1 restriction endonuclease subunit R [Haloplanus rubicundus]